MLRMPITIGKNLVHVLLFGAAMISFAHCVPNETTCEDGIGCTTGETSGKGGAGGKGGSSSGGIGGDGGSAGTPDGGEAGSSAGAGGSPEPCDGQCEGATPVCDTDSNTCVGCLVEGDCDASAPLCDTDSNTCVECLENADCTDEGASKCDAGQCAGCGANADCSHLSGTTVCDTTTSECVECTGTDYSACGDDGGIPLVCDSLARTCTSELEHDATACNPCVADAHCKLGQMCVLEQYGTPAEDVGYFCFWKKGDTANGAPTTCLPNARPYVDTIEDAISIDGTTADICGLRVSTCLARNEFGLEDCTTAAAPDDSKCSFDPPNDSKCVEADVGVYRCTMVCGNDDDCPSGFTCDTGAIPSVCEL